jgi:hypothetical protein
MIEYELTQSKHDEVLFFDQKKRLYVTIYVNDIKVFAPINQEIDELSNYLKIKYEMTDLRDVKWYLGMKIICLPSKNQKTDDQKNQNQIRSDQCNEVILLIQIKYVRNLLARHDMKNSAFVATSMIKTKLKKAFPGYKCLEKQLKTYQILLNELIHLMIQIRLDLAYSVSRLAQFMRNSTENH